MPETIGQQFKTAREKRNLSLDQVTEELHIREAYLKAIEEDQLENHLPSVQAKGFIRLYADFLGISPVLNPSLPEPSKQTQLPAEEEMEQAENNAPSDITETQSEQTIFVFGNQFKGAREVKELSIANIEQELHISQEYLKAIEEEDFEALPKGIQARGMVQRYAEFLEMDTENILDQYADLLLGKQPAAVSDKEKRKQVRKVDGTRQFLTPDVLIGLSILIIIFLIAFFGIRKVISTRNVLDTDETSTEAVFIQQTATPTIESVSTDENIQGTAVPGEIATATLQIRPTGENEGNTTSRVILQIIANQRAYLRVTADGEIVFEGRVKSGNIYEFYGEEKIEMMTGNAAALDITVIQDGRETQLGILGLVGQIINLTFQPDVIITPTVTPSLTPTVTNTPLPSGTPTVTSEPTITEEP